MPDDTQSVYRSGSDFQIEVMEPGPMRIYQVYEQDLRMALQASDSESLFLAFFCGCGGAFLSTVTSWMSTQNPSAWKYATYVSVSILLFVLFAVFCILWLLARSSRKKALKSIYERTGLKQNVPAQVSG